MRTMVVTSFRHGSRSTGVERHRFLLDPDYRDRPTRFEVDLLLNGVRWVYGFEVDDEHVREEYAYHWPRGRQALSFNREGGEVSFGQSFRASHRKMAVLLRDNSLLLSVAGAAGSNPLSQLFEWFKSNLLLFESTNRHGRVLYTAEMAQTKRYSEKIIGLLQAADLGITDLEIDRNILPSLDKVPEEFSPVVEHLNEALHILQEIESDSERTEILSIVVPKLLFIHLGARSGVTLSTEEESQGTLAWLSFMGPIINALQDGNIVLIDELDTSLHPILVKRLITMFQDPQLNPRHTQLIFNSHDSLILEGRGEWSLGRDQVWFVEKSVDGSTKLYSLDDFSPRNDDDIKGRYFLGCYGGVPVVGDSAILEALGSLD